MVSKANERNVIQMLQLLFASVNMSFSKNDAVDGADIISNFYKDIDPNMDLNDFIDALDKFANNSSASNASAYAKMEAAKEMLAAFNAQKSFRYDSINEKSINDYTVNHVYGKTVVKEDTQADRNRAVELYQQEQRDKAKAERDAAEDAYRRERDEKKDRNDVAKAQLDAMKNRITSNDLKKINSIEPTLLQINYNIVDNLNSSNYRIIETKSFLAGVKSRFVPVESIDFVERFVSKDKSKLSLKNLIRATTGEISFWKDFILCLDKIKMDSKNAAKKGPLANYWNILEKRAAKNNLRKLQRTGNDAAAITTVVLSQDTVNYMKNAYRFDLEDITNAKMIIDAYNLLGLMICDEATESVKVLYDGYNEFEVAAYRALERDNSDRDYKKTINLVNQLGR